MKEALIVIDMQEGFIEEGSPMSIRYAKSTIPACAAVLRHAREKGIAVFFVNRLYLEDGSNVEKARKQKWEQAGKPLTKSSAAPLSIKNPPEFEKQAGDYEIIKPRYSAFFQTQLDMILRRLGVGKIYLAGTTTPNCIRTTCYDGLALDYDVAVIEDCCSSNTMEIQAANMLDMGNIGAEIIQADDFLHI